MLLIFPAKPDPPSENAAERSEDLRLVPVRANRQPAIAAFMAEQEDRGHQFYCVLVFAIKGDAISLSRDSPNPL